MILNYGDSLLFVVIREAWPPLFIVGHEKTSALAFELERFSLFVCVSIKKTLRLLCKRIR